MQSDRQINSPSNNLGYRITPIIKSDALFYMPLKKSFHLFPLNSNPILNPYRARVSEGQNLVSGFSKVFNP